MNSFWRRARLGLVGWCGLLLLVSAGRATPSSTQGQQDFLVKGIVQELEPDGKTVVIQHEAISNYMGAMTMPFEVRDTNELRGLQPGDAILFHLIVNNKEGWISQITKLNVAPVQVPSRSSLRLSPAVELEEGDALPDFHFTNELGRPVDFSQYQGQAFAFTFFFINCPFPNFCPRMTHNFADAAETLSHATNAPDHWHLFSISFDSANDTPQRLLTYAENAHYLPRHWSFLTGSQEQIRGLADEFGESYWDAGGTISHNLRTVVVDTKGRVQKIYQGNQWTSDELVQQLLKAAAL